MADRLDPRLRLVVHVEALLSVLGALLDITSVLAADHATDVANGTGGLRSVVREMSGLATAGHTGNALGSLEALLRILGALSNLLAVRNPAGEILSLASPL